MKLTRDEAHYILCGTAVMYNEGILGGIARDDERERLDYVEGALLTYIRDTYPDLAARYQHIYDAVFAER